MTTETQKNELLQEFQQYLEQNSVDLLKPDEQPDLNTLLTELTALKTEVKTESRQFKNTLDTLSSSLATVQDDNKTLATELDANSERLKLQQHEFMSAVLLDMVDIYDRLLGSMEILYQYQPVASLFKHSREKDIRFIKHLREGQAMTVRRFEQILLRYQVRAIDCVGKRLDPVTMHAVETGHDPELGNGIVLEELRKGFLLQDRVLRLAEVKVNKTNS